MYSIEAIKKMSVRTLYRLLIKNMQRYPSKNRYLILEEVIGLFRRNRGMADGKERDK